MKKKCRICNEIVKGRSDKQFCSVSCKSYYFRRLNEVTHQATRTIDGFLHRNRSILLEILGKNKIQIKVPRIKLENKRFRFNYHTHSYINSRGKRYNYVYDIAWMEFSDDEILIRRRKK